MNENKVVTENLLDKWIAEAILEFSKKEETNNEPKRLFSI